MEVHFDCPHCGSECHVDEKFAGWEAHCLRCKGPLVVPGRNGDDVIDFYCPSCGHACHAPRSTAGQMARCTNCNSRFAIPRGDDVRGASAGTDAGVETPSLTRKSHKRRASTSMSPPPPPAAIPPLPAAAAGPSSAAAAGRSSMPPPPPPGPADLQTWPASSPGVVGYARRRRSAATRWIVWLLSLIMIASSGAAGILYEYHSMRQAPDSRDPHGREGAPAQAVFDPNDIRSTAMWAGEIIRPLNQIRDDNQLRSNQIAYEDAWTEAVKVAQRKSQEPVGRAVIWKLTVSSIDRWHVRLNDGFDGSGNQASGLDERLKINTNLAPLGNAPLVQGASLTVGEGITRERAARLRSGEQLTISGVINEVYLSQLIDGLWLTIELRDVKALD